MAIVLTALAIVGQRRSRLAQALLIPFGLFVCIDFLAEFVTGRWAPWLLTIASLLVQTIFAVTIHRLVLLGDDAVPAWGIVRWGPRERSFLFHLLIIPIITAIFAFAFFISIPVGVFALLLALYVIVRVSLVFPAIAVGHAFTIRDAWRLSGRGQVTLILILLILPLIFYAPALLVVSLPMGTVLNSVATSIALAIAVAVLSVAYAEFSKNANVT